MVGKVVGSKMSILLKCLYHGKTCGFILVKTPLNSSYICEQNIWSSEKLGGLHLKKTLILVIWYKNGEFPKAVKNI